MVKQQQQRSGGGEEEQPLVGPPVKRGRGRPRKVPLVDSPGEAWKGCPRPVAAKATTTSKCSVRITASEREIAEAKEGGVRENGAPVDSKEDVLVVSQQKVVKPPPPPRSLLPPQVKTAVIPPGTNLIMVGELEDEFASDEQFIEEVQEEEMEEEKEEKKTVEEKDTSVGQDGKSLNIEYPEPSPAIVDLAEVKRKPGRPKKRPDEDDDDDLDEEEMTLELDESSDEDDVEEMEVAATEEDGTVAPMKEVKVEKADDDEQRTTPRPSRSSRAAVKEEVEEPVVTKSGRKVVRPQSPPSVSKPAAERSPGRLKASPPKREEPSKEGDEEVDEKMREFDASSPCEFQSGQMTWARVGGAPFWPSVVVADPDLLLSMRVSAKGSGFAREYHVQFFGKAVRRAWVASSALLPFAGLEAFHEKAKEMKEEIGKAKTKQKLLKAYVATGNHRKAWDEAVQEAEDSHKYSDPEARVIHMKKLLERSLTARKRKLTHDGDSPEGQKKKRRRKDNNESVSNSGGNDGGFSEIDRFVDEIPLDVIERQRRKLTTGFRLFIEACRARNSVQDRDDKAVDNAWTKLTPGERRHYKERARLISRPPSVATDSDIDDSVSDRCSSRATNDDCDIDDASSTASSIKGIPATGSGVGKKQKESNKKQRTLVGKKPLVEMVGQFKRENCCVLCEEVSETPGDLVKCRGVCQAAFHLKCLETAGRDEELAAASTKEGRVDWRCRDCTKGTHPCQLCRSYKGQIFRCNAASCGRFFHADCLQKSGLWPQARYGEKQLTCPAHVCHTCASDNPKEPFMKYNKPLLRCIRCPTAYHSGDFCVTAGTVQITSSQIICPKHTSEPSDPMALFAVTAAASGKSKSSKASSSSSSKAPKPMHVNANWCFLCSHGGTLICCERCPASFHPECLKLPKAPEGQYFCDSCETGRMPLYNEVVWVKLGHYRWWPARVIHPAEVPVNVERSAHAMGEFPIKFCGSNDYYWINHGRCFLYEEGDEERTRADQKATSKASYIRGIKEAAELFEKFSAEKSEREAVEMPKMRNRQRGVKPPLYTKIKTNRPFGDCPIFTESEYDQQCECTQDMKAAPCSDNAECLNRILRIECDPKTCPTKDKCENRRFQKRVYPPIEVAMTNGRGWGLFIKEPVKKGSFIIEYVGELITMDEFKKRISDNIKRKVETNFYYLMMDSQRIIDAGPKGNIARFMNHSCKPNCETEKWTVNGDTRVGIFAQADIPAGTELTFDYQFEAMGDLKRPCLCGAKNCSGQIGVKPKGEDDDDDADASVAPKSKKNGNGNGNSVKVKVKASELKRQKYITYGGDPGTPPGPRSGFAGSGLFPNKEWEDLCFRCYDEGELLMCDYRTCPKVYHLACLGRDKMPREKWFCPWHHCVQCGKLAVAFCMHCPNAYCKNHNTVLTEHAELKTICDEHEDDLEDTVEFYRKVGGVQYVIPHPNVAPDEMLRYVRRGDETKENTPSNNNTRALIPPLSRANPNNSNTATFKNNAVARPAEQQPMSRSNGSRPANPLLRNNQFSRALHPSSSGGAPAPSSPQDFTPISGSMPLDVVCSEPDCDWRGDKVGAFYAHLSQAHRMKFLVAKEKVRAAVARNQKKVNPISTQLSTASHIPSPEKAALCKDRVVQCKICSKSLSQSNMARHLRLQHGRQSSPAEGASPSRGPSSSPAPAADMPYLCGYKGCTFRARTKFEMSGHGRHRGHPRKNKAEQQQPGTPEQGGDNSSSADDDGDALADLGRDSPAQAPSSASSSTSIKKPSADSISRRKDGGSFTCDGADCGYRSKFRSNLVRHCQRLSHYSACLAKTARTSLPLPDYLKNRPEGFVEAEDDDNDREEEEEQEEDEDAQMEEEENQEEVKSENAEEKENEDEEMAEKEENPEMAEKEDEKELTQEKGTEAKSRKKSASSSFCNFDLTEVLDEDDKKGDEAAAANDDDDGKVEAGLLNYKVL